MNSQAEILVNIAFHLAADNPAEAERILAQMPPEPGRDRFPPAIAWKMASADPARARRLTDQAQREHDRPYRYLFLALGLKSSDPAGASQAFDRAMQGMDRLTKGAEDYDLDGLVPREIVLPLVERLDPALVPEYFWRIVATRSPVGDPRSSSEFVPAALTLLLASYDRDVAAIVFEPVRVWLEHADDRELARPVVPIAFQGWSAFDPRAPWRGSNICRSPQCSTRPDYGLPNCSFCPTRHAGETSGSTTAIWQISWPVISGERKDMITPSTRRRQQTPAPSQTTRRPKQDKSTGRRRHPADPDGRSAVRSRTVAAALRLPRNRR